jgi:hydrogenase nickel incorporation protein HypA/HybF
MHELSIAVSIVDGVLEKLEQCGAAKACAVHVRVGRLSGVDKDALLFSYEVACQDTPLASSKLVIEDVEVTALCPACGCERSIQSFPMLMCAQCGTLADRLVHGNELEITALELEG